MEEIKEIKREFIERLHNRMNGCGMSVLELSRRMGLHYNTISFWFRGLTLPTPDKLIEAEKTVVAYEVEQAEMLKHLKESIAAPLHESTI